MVGIPYDKLIWWLSVSLRHNFIGPIEGKPNLKASVDVVLDGV